MDVRFIRYVSLIKEVSIKFRKSSGPADSRIRAQDCEHVSALAEVCAVFVSALC